MAGYNTVSEILALDRKAIVIPRIHPRREQLIRSQRLQQLGLLRMIEPDHLTGARLAVEVVDALRSTALPPSMRLEFTGLDRLTAEMHALLGEGSKGVQRQAAAV
jgi:predicted glycosyltransferase